MHIMHYAYYALCILCIMRIMHIMHYAYYAHWRHFSYVRSDQFFSSALTPTTIVAPSATVPTECGLPVLAKKSKK